MTEAYSSAEDPVATADEPERDMGGGIRLRNPERRPVRRAA